MSEGEEMYEGIVSVIEDEIKRYHQIMAQDTIDQVRYKGAIDALTRLIQIFEGEVE